MRFLWRISFSKEKAAQQPRQTKAATKQQQQRQETRRTPTCEQPATASQPAQRDSAVRTVYAYPDFNIKPMPTSRLTAKTIPTCKSVILKRQNPMTGTSCDVHAISHLRQIN
mmetsp:Transcript_10431/g.18044  ORF Transcript_10431/g.18044 Transcript_10431/m.18044 type:complete len:112 (+) Transcript_10431:163-498(+)